MVLARTPTHDLPSFDTCVHRSLPTLKLCLDELGYERCGHVLFGGFAPYDSWQQPNSLGMTDTCLGLLYSSLYKEQLDVWFSMFPRESFLILYRDDWTLDVSQTAKDVSSHLGLPFRPEPNPDVYLAKFVNHKYADLEMRPSTQDMLETFFSERDAWKSYLTKSDDSSYEQKTRIRHFFHLAH
eukprot:scaffold36274_cov41-Prasinocladus_malaysianus.AAC.1